METNGMLIAADRSVLVIVDVQERLAPAVEGLDRVLARLDLLLLAARETGVPVVMTEQYPAGLGSTLASVREAAVNARIVEKTTFGACAEPHFLETLHAFDRPLAIVCGMEAHVCVLQTALGLAGEGYETILVRDACASRRRTDLETAISRAAASGAVIATTEMVVFEWLGRADTASFRTVLQGIKALD
jgi:nicotinamidase-related amidase